MIYDDTMIYIYRSIYDNIQYINISYYDTLHSLKYKFPIPNNKVERVSAFFVVVICFIN